MHLLSRLRPAPRARRAGAVRAAGAAPAPRSACRADAPSGRARRLTLAVMLGYVVVAGAGAPVVRAFVMAAVLVVGRTMERRVDTLNGLGLAVLGLLLWRPTALFEVGFQLSFAAVGGLVACSPAVTARMPASWTRGPVRKAVVGSLAASARGDARDRPGPARVLRASAARGRRAQRARDPADVGRARDEPRGRRHVRLVARRGRRLRRGVRPLCVRGLLWTSAAGAGATGRPGRRAVRDEPVHARRAGSARRDARLRGPPARRAPPRPRLGRAPRRRRVDVRRPRRRAPAPRRRLPRRRAGRRVPAHAPQRPDGPHRRRRADAAPRRGRADRRAAPRPLRRPPRRRASSRRTRTPTTSAASTPSCGPSRSGCSSTTGSARAPTMWTSHAAPRRLARRPAQAAVAGDALRLDPTVRIRILGPYAGAARRRARPTRRRSCCSSSTAARAGSSPATPRRPPRPSSSRATPRLLRADVVKVGHHGSRTSSSVPFVAAASGVQSGREPRLGAGAGHGAALRRRLGRPAQPPRPAGRGAGHALAHGRGGRRADGRRRRGLAALGRGARRADRLAPSMP